MPCYVSAIKGNQMALGGTGIGGPTSKPSNLHADPSLPNAFNTNKSVPCHWFIVIAETSFILHNTYCRDAL